MQKRVEKEYKIIINTFTDINAALFQKVSAIYRKIRLYCNNIFFDFNI